MFLSNLRVLIVCISLLSLTVVNVVRAADINQRAIDEVKAGKTEIAYASWWGFQPEDSTAALQAAINSGAKKVIVEKMDAPWIVTPIQLASHQEIVFEAGAVIRSKKGEFKAPTASLFTAALKENVQMTGNGAVLEMLRADYDSAPYQKAEWRNGISVRTCSNVTISGLVIRETGGDGIYLGVAKPGVTNRKITIRDVVFERNYRQGVSIISAEDLLIEDCVFKETSGTAPMAGVDFEPNRADECLVNCVLRNCVSENNKGPGYLLYLPNLTRESKPVSIRFENCRSMGQSRALSCTTRNNNPGSVTGSIEFENCSFRSIDQVPVTILDKPTDVCPITFKNCTIIGPENQDATLPAIQFIARPGVVGQIGGVTFTDCVLKTSADHLVMSFYDASYLSAVTNVTGNLQVQHKNRDVRYKLTPELIQKWMPASEAGDITPWQTDISQLKPLNLKPESGSKPRRIVRQRALSQYLLYAKQGDQVVVQLTYHQLARYTGDKMPVTVKAPSGKVIPVNPVPFKESANCEFQAPDTGVYRISCDPGANFVTVD
ncbi:MAG: right-handed parallel beta-helix repeat-containing protein, partial [Planctomycetaceae bacterium]|nr:right-handed parallel beta-helix repeat-containing protein [Planctomycetaceae bacterium]